MKNFKDVIGEVAHNMTMNYVDATVALDFLSVAARQSVMYNTMDAAYKILQPELLAKNDPTSDDCLRVMYAFGNMLSKHPLTNMFGRPWVSLLECEFYDHLVKSISKDQ